MGSHMSEFERGQRMVKILVAVAVALALVALFFTGENSTEMAVLVIASFACFVGVFFVAARHCRCPHCGKKIISGVLSLKVCPKCKRSLITGKKIKK